jgi:hypothetical protein
LAIQPPGMLKVGVGLPGGVCFALDRGARKGSGEYHHPLFDNIPFKTAFIQPLRKSRGGKGVFERYDIEKELIASHGNLRAPPSEQTTNHTWQTTTFGHPLATTNKVKPTLAPNACAAKADTNLDCHRMCISVQSSAPF